MNSIVCLVCGQQGPKKSILSHICNDHKNRNGRPVRCPMHSIHWCSLGEFKGELREFIDISTSNAKYTRANIKKYSFNKRIGVGIALLTRVSHNRRTGSVGVTSIMEVMPPCVRKREGD